MSSATHVEMFLASRADDKGWGADKITQALTKEMLVTVRDVSYNKLEISTKLNLLLSFLLLRKRQREELNDVVNEILAIAELDGDEWVQATAQQVGALRHDGNAWEEFSQKNESFAELVNSMREALLNENHARTSIQLLPLEMRYLTRVPDSVTRMGSGEQRPFSLKPDIEAQMSKEAAIAHLKSLLTVKEPTTKSSVLSPRKGASTLPPPRPVQLVPGSIQRKTTLAGMKRNIPAGKKKRKMQVLDPNEAARLQQEREEQLQSQKKKQQDAQEAKAQEKERAKREKEEAKERKKREKEEKARAEAQKKLEEQQRRDQAKMKAEEDRRRRDEENRKKQKDDDELRKMRPQLQQLQQMESNASETSATTAQMQANTASVQPTQPMLPSRQPRSAGEFFPPEASSASSQLSAALGTGAEQHEDKIIDIPAATKRFDKILGSYRSILDADLVEHMIRFIAGDHEKPSYVEGHTETILLSEIDLNEVAKDGKARLVERFVFEMNYATGKHRRLRRKIRSGAPSSHKKKSAPISGIRDMSLKPATTFIPTPSSERVYAPAPLQPQSYSMIMPNPNVHRNSYSLIAPNPNVHTNMYNTATMTQPSTTTQPISTTTPIMAKMPSQSAQSFLGVVLPDSDAARTTPLSSVPEVPTQPIVAPSLASVIPPETQSKQATQATPMQE